MWANCFSAQIGLHISCWDHAKFWFLYYSYQAFVILSDQTKRLVIPSDADCTRFYAFPKIHKFTLVFFPIVSNIKTASYELTLTFTMPVSFHLH